MMSHKKVFGLFLAFFMLLTTCQTRSTPEHILSEEIIIQVLVDVHRAEALIMRQRTQIAQDSVLILQRMLEEEIYRSYSITDSIYIKSLAYYTKQDGAISKIYEQVVRNLEK